MREIIQHSQHSRVIVHGVSLSYNIHNQRNRSQVGATMCDEEGIRKMKREGCDRNLETEQDEGT